MALFYTKCSLDSRVIRKGFGYIAAAHPESASFGSLSDDDFEFDGTTYTVWRVTYDTNRTEFDWTFAVATGGTLTEFPAANLNELSVRFSDFSDPTTTATAELSAATYSAGNGYRWVPLARPSGFNSWGIGDTAAVRLVRTVPPDTTAPRVMSVERQDPSSSPTNADSLTWRITFSEDVKNVDAADFAIAGTTATVTAVTVATASTVFDVTASGGNLAVLDATVTLSFASGQDIADTSDNALSNSAPTGTNDDTWVVDNTAPTVTITGVPPTSTAAFTATFTFSEAVTGFVVADITLGNATASTFSATSTTVYTALITPTANGAVTVDVAAAVALDAAGNGNPAAARASSTYTMPVPTITIAAGTTPVTEGASAAFTLTRSGGPPGNPELTVNVSVTETEDMVAAADKGAKTVTFQANSATAMLGVATVADSVDETDSVVTANPATYTVGTSSSATVTVTDDDTRGVMVSALTLDVNEGSSGTYTVVLDSEPTASVTVTPSSDNSDVTVSSALTFTTMNWSTAQMVTVTAAHDSDAVDDSATISHAVAGGDYGAVTATSVTVTVDDDETADTTAPRVASIVRGTPSSSPTNVDSLTWRVTFSEMVSNVDAADFAVSGTTATLSVSAVSGVTGAYDVTASGGNLAGVTATVTLSIASGHDIQDAASNALTNTTPTGANDNTYVVDNTAPTVTITGVPPTSTAAFTATFTFTEAVTGFVVGDITLGNATASSFMVTSTTVYTVLITPVANGAVTVDVAADAATDAAGNGNTAATQASSNYTGPLVDTIAPRVASIVRRIPSSSPTNANSLKWRITFTENVKNVNAADFAIAGTTATVTAVTEVTASTVYDVTASGGDLAGLDATVTLSFASGRNIADTSDNVLSNPAPTGTNDNTWVVDNTAPTVAITGVPATSTAAFTATFTFSEDVTGFTVNDIDVDNGAASAFTATTARRVYTALITPAANGAVTVDVAADAATDAAGNRNPAATRASSTYTVVTAPGEPASLTARAGDAQVTLIWTPPALDGGAPIERYQYRHSAGSTVASRAPWMDVPDADSDGSLADERSVTVPDLDNARQYAFEVRAVNQAVNGRAARAVAIPVRAPLPPGSGFLVSNFGQTVDGAAQIFVTQDIVGVFTTGAQGADLHSIELRLFARHTGVTNIPSATLYRASVTDSRVTRGARVATLTVAPGSSRPTKTAKTVAFNAPAGTRLDAGATYLVLLEEYSYVRAEATTYPAEDAGGEPGWEIDGIGVGNNSPYSYGTTSSLLMRVNGTPVGPTVATAPEAPASLGATARDAQVTLSWTPPGSDGGAGIEKYQYRYSAVPYSADPRVDPETAWTDVPDGSDTDTSLADERAGAAATATAAPAAPRRRGFLVSNFGRPVDGAAQIYVTHDIVGVFTTGAQGADLHSIEFRLFTRRPNIALLPIPSVTLYRASVTDSRATQDERVAALTAVPGTPQSTDTAQTVAFAAPSGTRLEAGATYLVVLEHTFPVGVQYTNSPAQDAGGASGWTIDGVGAGNSSPWSYGTSGSLLMSVNGTTATAARQAEQEQEQVQVPATTPDPDRGISLSPSSASAIEGQAVTIGARRAGPTDRRTSVTVQVFDSALDGAWPMDLVFRPGVATATATVAIPFDGARPASRTVTVRLASVEEPYSVGSPSSRTFNVIERDAALRVHDASVSEGPGATLAFAVTLDRTRDREVRVKYATSDGTAKQGEDYTGVSGTLRFAPGETSKTVSVPVLDDAHDEGTETLVLRLSAARRAVIEDGVATGSIENSDPMPVAWMVRFGRTVGSQVVDALSGRLEGGRGSHLTVAGIPLGGTPAREPAPKTDDPFALPEWATPGAKEEEAHTLTAEDLLLRSSFHLRSGGEDGAGLAFTTWGHAATGGFQADDMKLDGSDTTGLIGFDAEWDRALAGVMLSHSIGEGSYRLDLAQGDDAETVKSDLTGVYPYARINLNARVSAWALAGAGSGSITLKPGGGDAMKMALSMRMGALGVKGQVLDGTGPSGMRVNVKSDAMWVGTKSARSADMVGSEGDATRLRLVAQGERDFALAGRGRLTPSAELGLRHDAGDAETGMGVELGAGLRYRAGSFTIEGQARTLVAHEASGYEDWGVSGAVRLTPSASGRGLSLSVAPTWGRTGSASERLWSARDAGELEGGGAFEADGRIEAEVGYGLALPHNRGLLTPYGALTLASEGGRTMRGGARWMLDSDLAVTLEATRSESAGTDAGSEVRIRAALRF